MVSVSSRMRKLKSACSLEILAIEFSPYAWLVKADDHDNCFQPLPSLTIASLEQLLNIRFGPGALILPSEIKRIHLQFAPKFNGGHMGARKFWRDVFPRLKYHNPGVSMTVDRSEQQTGNSFMTIFYVSPKPSSQPNASQTPSSPTLSTPSSTTSNPSAFSRVETIDMKEIRSEKILEQFIKVTQPTPVLATEAEKQELKDLEEEREKAEVDRTREAMRVAKKRRDRELLQKARQATGLVEGG